MITTGNWPDALEPIARKNYQIGIDETPKDDIDLVFTQRKGSKLTETYMESGDIAPMGLFKGTIDYVDISEGYKRTATVTQMAQGIKIQRIFVETDQQDVVTGLPKNLGVSAQRRKGGDGMAYFNNAFNTSYVTIDNLQLCSTAHTSNNGGSTQSNSGTTAFSGVAVEATRINGRKFLTNTDNKAPIKFDMLIVPPDLESAAWEVISSGGKVDTANNNANFHKGKYKLLVSDWLDDTNNWFFVNSSLMKRSMDWFNVINQEFTQAKDFDGQVAKFAVYMAYGFFARDWRPFFGHNVS